MSSGIVRGIWKVGSILLAVYFWVQAAVGQTPNAAWPNVLDLHSGKSIQTVQEFIAYRRPEILRELEENVYGHTPNVMPHFDAKVMSEQEDALGGLAIRKQVTITLGDAPNVRRLHLLLYLPAHNTVHVPVFIGLNFDGNQTVNADPGIELNDVWNPEPELDAVPLAKQLKSHLKHRAMEKSRGASAGEWPIIEILKAGFGVATMYAGDVEPDFAAGIGYGVRPLLFKPGQTLPETDEWGAIGAWAWGMSRMVDYLQTDSRVDPHALIAIGHSRFGKAALWAGAQDQRFSIVISNESGQGGATLSHRETGEPISHLNIAFPYWFCANYHHFTGRTRQLPVDGHFLLALIAPRPLFVASAESDPFSDPRGEFLSAVAASDVYHLFGEDGVNAAITPELSTPVGKTLRYYIRPGGHDILLQDWKQYIAFAEEALRQRGQQTAQ